MRNLTITQASESHATGPRFDASGPVLVEAEDHLATVQEIAGEARVLHGGGAARALVASTAAVARAAVEAGVPVLLDASDEDEIRFLEESQRALFAFWDDETLRERLAWLLDRLPGAAEREAPLVHARDESELRLWIARMRAAERRRHVEHEGAVAAANDAHRREIERLEARASAAERRVEELAAHIAAIESTRAWAFAQRLQRLAHILRGGRGR
jgi:hypothetical protein